MNHHRGHQSGIVAFLAQYTVVGDESPSLVLQRNFRQKCEEPLEGGHFHHSCLNRKTKAVLRRRTGRNSPELDEILRGDVQRLILN